MKNKIKLKHLSHNIKVHNRNENIQRIKIS